MGDTADWSEWLGAQVGPTGKAGASPPADWGNWLAGQTSGAPAPASPPPQYSGADRLLRLAGQAAATGLANTLGLPGDLEAFGARHGAPRIQTNPFGIPNVPEMQYDLPTSDQILAKTNSLGITGRADLSPQTPAEIGVAGASGGLASSLPIAGLTALTGGAALPVLAAGATGGTAAEFAHQAFPESEIAPIAAGTLAGFGTQGLTSALSGNTFTRVAGKLAPSVSAENALTDAGQAVQSSARNWLSSTLPAKLAATWAPVDAVVPASSPAGITNFVQALSNMTNKGGTLSPLVDALSPTLPKKLLDLIQSKTPIGAQTWGDLQELRTSLGAAMGSPRVLADIPEKQLDQLYSALSHDMEQVALFHGAGDLFSQANAQSRQLFNFAGRTVGNIVKGGTAQGNDPLPESVVNSYLSKLRSGGTQLSELRSELPDAADAISAAALHTRASVWRDLPQGSKDALVPDRGLQNLLDAAPRPSKGGFVAALGRTVLHAGETGGATAAGAMLSNALGVPVSPVIAGLTAAAVPLAFRGARSLLTSPGALRVPLAGGVAGDVPFALDETEQQKAK